MNVESLGIDQLTVGQRLQLIDLIWDSLPAQVESHDVPAWHLAELARRRAIAETNPGGVPWRQALNALGSKS